MLEKAVSDILDTASEAFINGDAEAALKVEPLEQVIDILKEQMRTRHILRMQKGNCSIEAGFVWSDLLTDLERTSDHCSNIAGSVIDAAHDGFQPHQTLRSAREESTEYRRLLRGYESLYSLPSESK